VYVSVESPKLRYLVQNRAPLDPVTKLDCSGLLCSYG
jgi:hypothetical protein